MQVAGITWEKEWQSLNISPTEIPERVDLWTVTFKFLTIFAFATTLTFNVLTSKSNKFIFVPTAPKTVNLVRYRVQELSVLSVLGHGPTDKHVDSQKQDAFQG